MEEILWDVKSIASDANSSVKSLPTQINAVHQHMDANKGQLIDAINNVSGGSSGLTSQQKTQLRNAAKANSNQKLLKELKPLVEQSLAVTKAVERNLDWFNEDFTAYSEKQMVNFQS